MSTCCYHYDALDRLATRTDSAQHPTRHFYQASRLATAIGDNLQRTILATDRQLLAQKDVSTASERSHLFVTDQQDSVLTAASAGQRMDIAYSPYGHRQDPGPLPGFTGQESDPLTGHYLLGNGYRAYNPVLKRFNSPDSLSPFGEGGLNAYAYCEGDPVNRSDLTGHISSPSLLRMALRLVARTSLRNVEQVSPILPGKVISAGGHVADVGGARPWVKVPRAPNPLLKEMPDHIKDNVVGYLIHHQPGTMAQVSKAIETRVMTTSAANFKKQGIADLPFQKWLEKLDGIYFGEMPGIAPGFIRRQGITLELLRQALIRAPRQVSGRTIRYQSNAVEPGDMALQIQQIQAMNGGGF